jgi:hypothetical protein
MGASDYSSLRVRTNSMIVVCASERVRCSRLSVRGMGHSGGTAGSQPGGTDLAEVYRLPRSRLRCVRVTRHRQQLPPPAALVYFLLATLAGSSEGPPLRGWTPPAPETNDQ